MRKAAWIGLVLLLAVGSADAGAVRLGARAVKSTAKVAAKAPKASAHVAVKAAKVAWKVVY